VESIYFVMSWLCHRTCEHGYQERCHQYHGADLREVIRESGENAPRIIANLPDRMAYFDLADPDQNGNFQKSEGASF
jgi:hypothetical protein